MAAREKLPSLAAAAWLTAAPTQAVLRAIANGGFPTRAVGGVVRNALIGAPVTDVDIATTARPDDVIRLARAAGLGVIETGLKHGTVTVIADHQPFEVTTLRTDVASHGRHATVAFTADWTADASRRDFTINALYCDADGTVHDPLGGYADLVARRVRFIGDPRARIREDYLRILRFFRFTATYAHGPIDRDGLAAAVAERRGLAILSAERVRQEVVRLLTAPRVLDVVDAMQSHGILAEILPVVPRPTLLARIVAIEAGHDLAPDAMARLAALGVETLEDAARLAQHLRLSRAEADHLRVAAGPAARAPAPPDAAAAKAWLYRLGPADYRRALAQAWARQLATSTRAPQWSDALTLPERWVAPRLPVGGADVMARGVPAGPPVGEMLASLEAWWIAEGFAPDRDALLAQLTRSLQRAT